MFYFLTTLRHPSNANSYSAVVDQLRLTVNSVLGQRTKAPFKLLVVCNEDPGFVDDARVEILTVPFRPPGEGKGEGLSLRDMHCDKGLKLAAGLLHMKSDDPDHVFIIDADDWVSLDVVDFVSKEARTRGGSDFWYVDKGYLVNIQDKKLVRKHGLCRYCGTSFIYDYRKLMLLVLANNPAPSSISEEAILKALGEFIVVSFLGNHRYQFGHLAKFGCKPAPIPFYSICWILNTGENHSGQTGGSSGLPITAGMLDQFGQNHTLASSERASVRSRVTELLDMMKSKVGWMLTDKRAERV